MNYKGKVVLITGASSGIGRAVAVALSKHGNRIVVTARRADRLESLAKEVEDNGSECRVIPGDATEQSHARAVVETAVREFGAIDIAILNVGGGPASNTLTASVDTILHVMRSNYDSLINFFVPVLSQMKQQSHDCLIAHMNSLATYFGIPMQGDYTAAKAAARIFLDTARMELAHFGYHHIKIQTIHPGFVATETSRNDGIPAPNEISEEKAAEFVLKGIRTEKRENRFPWGTAVAVRVGRIAPYGVRKRVLLAAAPKDY